ncbi:MAG: DUF2905 domain-containing protein [candidate division WOR-3 bacterium]|nr:MAG: DUF2905 domain-containing protein [candidate division WOR-3 bacterium]
MSSIQALARLLVVVGLLIALAGVALLLLVRFGWLRLPGDILVQRRNLVVYIPVASALVLSLVLTLVLNLLFRK